MIIAKITSSLSHSARHHKGRLYDCLAFLQAWLLGHISSLPLSTPRQNPSISTLLGKKVMVDYQELLTNLSAKYITWKAKWHKVHYPYLFLENRTYMVLTGLHQSTPYVPIRVLHQFNLRQDLFNFIATYADIYKLHYKMPHLVWSQLTILWNTSHTQAPRHLPLVSTKMPKTSPPYDSWILNLILAQSSGSVVDHPSKRVHFDKHSTS